MQVIIDRFENDYAVVELDNGIFVDLPKVLVPNAHEGDVVDITVNTQETENRHKKIQKLMNNLFED